MTATIAEAVVLTLIMGGPQTAAAIQSLGDATIRPLNLASLSSVLRKMVKSGVLAYCKRRGPRGGHVYRLSRKTKRQIKIVKTWPTLSKPAGTMVIP
jgi:hypothetical protein